MLYHLRDIVGKKRTDKILLCKNKKKTEERKNTVWLHTTHLFLKFPK